MLKLHPGTAMVAFFLPEDRATMLATADGEPAGNLHVTSIYFGDTAEIQEQRNAVLRLVKVLSIDTPPFSGSLNRLSHFGPDDDGLMAVVLEVDSPELREFHDSIAASLEEAGIPWNQKFPNYRPHVTLGYWPEDEIPERYSKPGTIDPIQVTFTEASVKWDGERFDNPLGECVVASVQEFDWRNQPRDRVGRWASTGGYFTEVKTGGRSINLRNGEVPSTGFAVGRTKGISMPDSEAFDSNGELSPVALKRINKFILLRRRELFSKTVTHPVVLGVFHDTDNGVVDVDISDILPPTSSLAKVKSLAAKRNQKSVYSLHDHKLIDTGGTGDTRALTADSGSAAGELREVERDGTGADSRNPIAVLQASAVQVEEVRFYAVQPLEFHGDPDDTSVPYPHKRRLGGRVPATRPTTVGGLKKFDPGTPIRIEPSLHGDKQRAAILQRIASVPGFEDTAGLDVEAGETAVLERLSRNIQENFERSVEDYGLERTLKHSEWYPAAHDAGVSWAKEFGFDEDAVFAALAVLSPQADWGDNVAWSRFVAEKIHDQENIEITQEIVDAYEAAQQIAYRGQVKEFESGKRPTKPKAPVPSGLPVGNMLSEVSDEQAAQVIRGMGNAEGLMQGLFGNPKTKARANRDSAIANAVSVLRDPTTENISSRLGNEHKVRSFYNNIRDPMDTKFEDVTADTHHFGAAFGHPWSGSSAFLSSGKRDKDGNPLANKNIWGAVGTGDTGASGAYALVVEATRIATERVNAKYKTDLRPAQMQSVVWEYHRNSWPARARKSVVGAIETVRTDEASGSISHDEAMSRIDAIREAAPGAAPRNKLLEQMLGTYKPTKKTRQRVIQND